MTSKDTDIAIIGMAGRFPGAPDLDAFWRNLRDGVESITHFSESELAEAGVAPELLKHPQFVKAGMVLDEIDRFDAAFFGFSPKEAEILDPQARLLLECAWEAMERSGYHAAGVSGPIGVFAGCGASNYFLNLLRKREITKTFDTHALGLANNPANLATRISYKLDLKGPSMTVLTACSTSLVAVHLACQSLLTRESDMALAGGVSLKVPQNGGYLYKEGGILSPDGRCRAFDADANGTAGGNGLGMVVLKRLNDALQDGDTVVAVIKASAINNDGGLKAGFTAPTVAGQAAVIAEALALADVEAESIAYIEAHGTGTPLGDPIELVALTRVFQNETQKRGFCWLGSLKTNIGHLDAAAGIAGLIKTCLALQYETLPPSLNFKRANPKLDLENGPFNIVREAQPWPRGEAPRRAGISSFGVGGTNAHVVLEEAPPPAQSGTRVRGLQLFPLSAKTAGALDRMTDRVFAHLRQDSDQRFEDVAYTLACGRQPMNRRRFFLAQDRQQALALAEDRDSGQVYTGTASDREPEIVFLFPGQGAQYRGMAAGLFETEPLFRQSLAGCAELLRPHLGLDLLALLFPKDEADAPDLDRTEHTQPALFAVSYALAEWWRAHGVRPAAMIGHSIGEYVAATLAGVLELEDALELVALRGRLMAGLPPGAMLVQSVPQAELSLPPELSLAAVNHPCQTVVSGETQAVAAWSDDLKRRGIAHRRLNTSHAFHSTMMDPILETFAAAVRRVPLGTPRIPYISNLTGDWITERDLADPNYWVRHLRHTVRFSDGIRTLLAKPDHCFLEVGPGHVLGSLVRRQLTQPDPQRVLDSMVAGREEQTHLLTSMGKLWLQGANVDWQAFHGPGRQRVPLPTYPFERQSFWVDPDKPGRRSEPRSAAVLESGLGVYAPTWTQALPLPKFPDIAGDRPEIWLIFKDARCLGELLAERLRALGHRAIEVGIGDRFLELGSDRFETPPGSGIEDLFRELEKRELVPSTAVHLWLLDPLPAADSGRDRFDRAQTLGYESLLAMAGAAAASGQASRLVVVGSGLWDVSGAEPVEPEKATALGLLKTIPQEYEHVRCQAVDVGPDPSVKPVLVDRILAETRSERHAVALRGRTRWTRTHTLLDFGSVETPAVAVREKGVYLITGGLGKVGMALAGVLARRRARLALVGRNPFPARSDWETLRGQSGREARAAAHFLDWEKNGARIEVHEADVADEAAMDRIVRDVRQRHGALHGVFHLAGVTGSAELYRALGEIDGEHSRRQFHAKCRGTEILARVLSGAGLDFLVCFSSTAAVLGGLGMGAYAAANAFMDAAAQAHARDGLPWLSVNWDGWRLDEETQASGVGTGAARYSMSVDEGLRALENLLAHGVLGRAVAAHDLEARLAIWVGQRGSRSEQNRTEDGTEAPTFHARPEMSAPYTAPTTPVQEAFAVWWRDLLGIEPIGIHDNFLELGGHSLLGTQVISRIRDRFGIKLPLTVLFEGPTIAELAEAVERHGIRTRDDDAEIEPVQREEVDLDALVSELEGLSEEELEALKESI